MTDKKIHPCEPNLDELVSIRSKIYGKESTDLNVKKCKALESQIERHKAIMGAKKAEQKEEVPSKKTKNEK